MDDNLLTLIHQHGLDRIIENIEPLVASGLQISTTDEKRQIIGASRFGGLPDLPQNIGWPQWKNRPLGFLGQIQCGDLAGMDPSGRLPSAGLLSFFYDFEDQPWGFDPAHAGSTMVLYTEASTPLTSARLPENRSFEDVCLVLNGIEFKTISSLPSLRSAGFEKYLTLEDNDRDRYQDFYYALCEKNSDGKPWHQLLGHSINIQNDMTIKCELVSNGLYCGDSSGYEDPRAAVLKPRAAEWRLLVQFDSDDDLGVMWGDSGMLYFWIYEEDLRARNFSKSWAILQCC